MECGRLREVARLFSENEVARLFYGWPRVILEAAVNSGAIHKIRGRYGTQFMDGPG